MKRRIATMVCAVAAMFIICPALSAQVSEKDHIEVVGRAEKKVKPAVRARNNKGVIELW